MCRGVRKTLFSLALIVGLVLFSFPQLVSGQVPGKGNVIGFVYGQDGTTPITGAIVVVKNVSSGKVFESTKSDSLGVFKVQGVDAGMYSLGVTSVPGDFNSIDLVGVVSNETAKVAIALNPYENNVAAAAAQVTQDQQEKGESRIGRVVAIPPNPGEVEVFIERGLLQVGDRVHVKGESTDFYQDAKVLKIQGASVKKAFVGQNVLLSVVKPTTVGDLVFVSCKRGIPPLFLAPLGVAAVVAGGALLTPGGGENPASIVTPGQVR